MTKQSTYEVHFPKGLPGFERYTDYELFTIEEGPFGYLQCVEDQDLVFHIVDPFAFYPEYTFQLPDHAINELQILSESDVAVRCIITIKDSLASSTVNLIAPLVFHTDKHIGKQVILTDTVYSTKHPLLQPSHLKGV